MCKEDHSGKLVLREEAKEGDSSRKSERERASPRAVVLPSEGVRRNGEESKPLVALPGNSADGDQKPWLIVTWSIQCCYYSRLPLCAFIYKILSVDITD